MRKGVSVSISALSLMVLPATIAPASAQGNDVAAARDAYDRGAAAYDAGEYALAAQQLQKADALVANDVALELALKAAVKANDALLAMDLAGRADGRQSSAVLAARDDARSKMGPRTGRVTITCPPGTTNCTATFDDAAFPVGKPRWVLVGQHSAVITDSSGGRQAFQVRVDPSAAVDVAAKRTTPIAPLTFGAPSSSDPRRDGASSSQPADARRKSSGAASSEGVSPLWFWAGTGLTAVLGGATIASALDTRSKHESFAAQPSQDLSNDGFNAQVRTNLLLVGTVASFIVTAATGLFFVKWSSSTSTSSSSPVGAAR